MKTTTPPHQQGLRHRHKKRLMAAALAAIASASATTPAVAQDDSELEEITVTGTRIRATDGMAEPTPVTSMTPQELMNFEPGGTVAEQLDALPQFFATGTAQRGGNALFSDGGGSYLDMRGLGRNRTLVLLDGSRIVPADKRGTVNVDNIPTALVRSVDVVTGGASAAYGADALAGVTNFVLDREFQGLKTSISTGMNEFNQDGKNVNLSIAGGRQFGDRLNVIGSLEARKIEQIERLASELDTDWSQRWGYLTYPPGTTPASRRRAVGRPDQHVARRRHLGNTHLARRTDLHGRRQERPADDSRRRRRWQRHVRRSGSEELQQCDRLPDPR